MTRFASLTRNARRPRRLILTWFVIGSCLIALPARGGVGLGGTATYPPLVQVGQTNVAVSISINNVSAPPASTTLNSIKHTPSCGESTAPCPAGSADPGVFAVKGPASGRTGTACAGISFTLGSPDLTTGEVEFIPGSAVTLPTDGSLCAIDFFVDVLKVPTKNASAGPTIQTAPVVRAAGSAGASGTGGTLVTVQAQTRRDPVPAATPTTLAIVAVLLTGFGVLRLRRRAATQRSDSHA